MDLELSWQQEEWASGQNDMMHQDMSSSFYSEEGEDSRDDCIDGNVPPSSADDVMM